MSDYRCPYCGARIAAQDVEGKFGIYTCSKCEHVMGIGDILQFPIDNGKDP